MVKLLGSEVPDAIPQREIRRGRLLRLERARRSHGIDDTDGTTIEQTLPGKGRPVESPVRQHNHSVALR